VTPMAFDDIRSGWRADRPVGCPPWTVDRGGAARSTPCAKLRRARQALRGPAGIRPRRHALRVLPNGASLPAVMPLTGRWFSGSELIGLGLFLACFVILCRDWSSTRWLTPLGGLLVGLVVGIAAAGFG